jgi:8-oxo-dGTP diphosphatase
VPTPTYILDIRRSYGQGRLLLPGVSGVVVRDDIEPGRRHILLLRRADTGRWSLPAGIVEPDEQPATTIVRELLEETRVHVRAERLTLLTTDPELTYPNGDRCQYISMTFRCAYVGGEAQVGDDESTEVAWFRTDQLPPGLPALLHRRIAAALADRQVCVFDS